MSCLGSPDPSSCSSCFELCVSLGKELFLFASKLCLRVYTVGVARLFGFGPFSKSIYLGRAAPPILRRWTDDSPSYQPCKSCFHRREVEGEIVLGAVALRLNRCDANSEARIATKPWLIVAKRTSAVQWYVAFHSATSSPIDTMSFPVP